MKKFFLMLAVALPMFFMASCGDDNDDVNFFDRDIEYSMPVLTKATSGELQISNNSIALEWGDDMDDVKQAMRPFSYVLNTSKSSDRSLVYNYDEDLAYPWYVYSFSGDGLAASSITITEDMDDEVDFDAYLLSKGYKDVTDEDKDDDYVYLSKDKLTVVHYGINDDVTVVWVPNIGKDTRATSALAAIKSHLEIIDSLSAEKIAK